MRHTRIAIITAKLMSYRMGFHNLLGKQHALDTTLFYEINGTDVQLPEELHFSPIEIAFWEVPRFGITWHKLPIRRLWNDFDIFVFSGNPRILSTVLWATLFKLLGRKTLVWGHGHSPGAHPLTEKLRLLWWRMFDHILVYTDAEAQRLIEQGFTRAKLTSLNNGLDQSAIDTAAAAWTPEKLAEWQEKEKIATRVVLLSCARLLEKNRFQQMLACLPELRAKIPNLLWCVIGDGPLKAKLQTEAHHLGVSDRVRWLGAIYEEEKLAPWFLSSRLLIHPSTIGLTLMHAFGYGLPVITHDNARNHGPEITILQPGYNGLVYQENNAQDLIAKILVALEDETDRQRWSQAARCTVRTKYNIETMARNFTQAVSTLYEVGRTGTEHDCQVTEK